MSKERSDELQELLKQKKKIDKRIREIEKAEREKSKRETLAEDYAKVVCLDCEGEGLVTVGGADIESDPPEDVPCEICRGKGYLMVRRFVAQQKHDMEYDERDF